MVYGDSVPGVFIAGEAKPPTNYMAVQATRMISVCQLRSFVRSLAGFSSFGSRQSVYHLFSTQSRVSILATFGNSRRHHEARPHPASKRILVQPVSV